MSGYFALVRCAVRHTTNICQTQAVSRRPTNKLSIWGFSSGNMEEVKGIIDGKIAGRKVMMFSKSYCPFCTKAKRAFADLMKEGVLNSDDYEIMEIEDDPKCEEIQNYFQKLTGGKSVPRVFIDGKFIGGGDDTVKMKASGELKSMLS